MNYLKIIFTLLLFSQLISSCSSGSANSPANTSTSLKNTLTMKINGKDWTADSEIMGAFHPKGYDQLIMIAGSFGPNNKDEQSFNINIYNASGPYRINVCMLKCIRNYSHCKSCISNIIAC